MADKLSTLARWALGDEDRRRLGIDVAGKLGPVPSGAWEPEKKGKKR